MQRLQRASVNIDQVREKAAKMGMTVEAFLEHLGDAIWKNDVYTVFVRELGDNGVHLSIKRNDREPIHDWRDLQAIKNQILGRECEAVELYPAEERRVDTANQFHLWGVRDKTWRFPFGYNERLVQSDPNIDGLLGAKQRPFEPEEP